MNQYEYTVVLSLKESSSYMPLCPTQGPRVPSADGATIVTGGFAPSPSIGMAVDALLLSANLR